MTAQTLNLLDASDELSTARDLVELISTAHRSGADEEGKAVAAACEIILGKLDAVRMAMQASVRPAVPLKA